MWLLLFLMLCSAPLLAQNTKGDKPAKVPAKVTQKAKAKPSKEKAKTKDISGRRLRTKNKSSAQRAVQSAPMRKPVRPARGDRAVRTSAPTIRSNTARSARSNVYPQSGPFINNPSKKPVDRQPKYSNKTIVKRIASNARKRSQPKYSNRNTVSRVSSNSARQSQNNIYRKGGPFVNNPSKTPRSTQPRYSNSTVVKRNTKNTERRSRNNIYRSGGPFVNNPSKTPRSTQPVYSNKGIVQRNVQQSKSRTRSNVFPQKGPYVNNPSSKPKKDGAVIFDSRSFVAKALNLKSKPGPPGKRGGRFGSASGSYVTRGRKNVYWGKFRKGERAITTDIAGRKLRTRNYVSPGLETIPQGNPYAKRKSTGDKSYAGPRPRFSAASKKSERAWRGDISGHALRRGRPTKSTETVGIASGGARIRTREGISNQPLPGVAPNLKNLRKYARFGNRLNGKKGGRLGTKTMANYQGNIKGGRSFGVQGAGYSGSIKSKRTQKGGGSISGSWNNYGLPLIGKNPARDAIRAGTFQGTFKTRRAEKGGGSVSGRARNNGYRPIDVKAPSRNDAIRQGIFQGNIKTKRPAKGGGSISGRARNNGNQPIDVRAPKGKGAALIGTFQGNMRYAGKGYQNQGEEFSGSIKAKKSKKGGGSISGRPRNNNDKAISTKIPMGKDAAKVGTYRGNYKFGELAPGFRDQGEEFSGFIKTKKPAKGGGSVSGKLWNNNEKPIDVRTPLSDDAKAANYSGWTKQSRFKKAYVKNPNAHELALKQKRPDETTYDVAGLQVKVKQGNFERNKKSSREALLAIGPNKNSVKASEYSGRMKVYWDYKHNPSSSDDAQKTIAGTKAFYRASSALTSRVRLRRDYRHNPASDKEALKVLSPGKAYARVNDFQGNLKMKKFNGKELHPDAKFAHNYRNNVKEERTILMNVKLFWSKVFKKNGTQTKAVKENVKRPRYDKKERELWKDLYE